MDIRHTCDHAAIQCICTKNTAFQFQLRTTNQPVSAYYHLAILIYKIKNYPIQGDRRDDPDSGQERGWEDQLLGIQGQQFITVS